MADQDKQDFIDYLFQNSETNLHSIIIDVNGTDDLTSCICEISDIVQRFSTDELGLIKKFLSVLWGKHHEDVHEYLDIINLSKEQKEEYESELEITAALAGTVEHVMVELKRRETEFPTDTEL